MRHYRTALFLTVAILISAAAPVMAHHSFAAEYDGDKFQTFKGVVTSIDWQNPHFFFYVDVTTDKGALEQWKFEGFPPNMLVRQGWKKDVSLKKGDHITITAWLARDGSKLAHSRLVTWDDGHSLQSGPPAGTGGN
ncbi:MAG: DUF6152 family protein [Acidobacteriota bacterium]